MDHSHFHTTTRAFVAAERGMARLIAWARPVVITSLLLGLVLVIVADGEISTMWRRVWLSILLLLDIIMIAWFTGSRDS